MKLTPSKPIRALPLLDLARRAITPIRPKGGSPFRAAGAVTLSRCRRVHPIRAEGAFTFARPKGGSPIPARRAFTSTRLARAEGAAFTLTSTLASQCGLDPIRELLQFRLRIGSPCSILLRFAVPSSDDGHRLRMDF
jgi:hypothetical protein